MALLRSFAASVVLAAAFAAHAEAPPLPSPPAAWVEAGFDEGEARLEARLLVHPERAPDGSLRAGVLFTLDPGWHLYWKPSGRRRPPDEARVPGRRRRAAQLAGAERLLGG